MLGKQRTWKQALGAAARAAACLRAAGQGFSSSQLKGMVWLFWQLGLIPGQRRRGWGGWDTPACVSLPLLALHCLSPLQTPSSCAQLCARPGSVCLSHVWGLGCDGG